jgi:iron(III) transport system ATP-binding protein
MLAIEDLEKSYEDVRALDRISLQVEPGVLFTLLGPSGCGKTTTLRCVAGLESPDGGEIVLGERPLFSSRREISVPAHERGLGVVFQSYALWPHMNVFQTVAFPLEVLPRRRRPPARAIRERVERTLAIVRLDALAARPATDLSGGQQQRLALARALVIEPPLLLMDEPLSSLDAQLRDDMRLELKRLQRELGVTSVYVTHDQAEALAMSNLIAVMRDGRIEQVGKPREIYERPRSRFVADFIGASNLIEGAVQRRDANGACLVSTAAGALAVARSDGGLRPGASVIVSIRSERVGIEPGWPEGAEPNRWRGTVHNRAFRGDAVDHVVAVGDLRIRARCDSSVSIPQGTEVVVSLPEEACSLLPEEP